jgi:F-type H+-transporting ATPase subunit b
VLASAVSDQHPPTDDSNRENLMLHAALLALQEGHTSGPLTVEGGLMLWTVVIFLLLLAVLKRFAWPAILGAVEARERALEQQLADAERSRTEAAALLEEHKRLVAEAKGQAHGILVDAKQLAEKERAVALEKTKQEQQEILARARREIAAERDMAVADLRREAVDLSLAAASKLVGERLGGESDRKIVLDYLATLDSGR